MSALLYDMEMGDQPVDLSGSERKFQTSIVVEQDPNKSGVLSFLQQAEKETPQTPTRVAPQTIRVNRSQEQY